LDGNIGLLCPFGTNRHGLRHDISHNGRRDGHTTDGVALALQPGQAQEIVHNPQDAAGVAFDGTQGLGAKLWGDVGIGQQCFGIA
jgi:hypothetical protein